MVAVQNPRPPSEEVAEQYRTDQNRTEITEQNVYFTPLLVPKSLHTDPGYMIRKIRKLRTKKFDMRSKRKF